MFNDEDLFIEELETFSQFIPNEASEATINLKEQISSSEDKIKKYNELLKKNININPKLASKQMIDYYTTLQEQTNKLKQMIEVNKNAKPGLAEILLDNIGKYIKTQENEIAKWQEELSKWKNKDYVF